jgi:hypothetical protein
MPRFVVFWLCELELGITLYWMLLDKRNLLFRFFVKANCFILKKTPMCVRLESKELKGVRNQRKANYKEKTKQTNK